MLGTRIEGTRFKPPLLFFTLNTPQHKNPFSAEVVKELESWAGKISWEFHLRNRIAYSVFPSMEEMEAALRKMDPTEAVVLFDTTFTCGGHFTYGSRGRTGGITIPSWSCGAQWAVGVGTHVNGHVLNCAQQILADFHGPHGFDQRLNEGHFPWGPRRKGELAPQRIKLPEPTSEILDRLQMGPNMLEGVHGDFVRELPQGSRISWIRVPGEAATYPSDAMERRLRAVAAFERASCMVLAEHPEAHALLLAGVHLPDPRLETCYLSPMSNGNPVTELSVRRPDMHVCGAKLVASENDEMPGGFTDLYHVDMAYRLHQDEWQTCLEWLHGEGSLVFVVSDEWSRVYITSTRWLVEELRARGWDTHIVTTAELDRVTVRENGVFLDDKRMGTIWRQFPVFETKDRLAKLVLAAHAGKVRMVPEFAHFGNKSWFALFHRFEDAFRAHLSDENFITLLELLPESYLVVHGQDCFPFRVASFSIENRQQLCDLPKEARDLLVLKVTGANNLAARSLGVLVGAAQNETTWRRWLSERTELEQPFIVQRRFDTSVETLAVLNMRTNAAEAFRCRVLLRPWVVGGQLVSSHNCATPHYTMKIHGMVDMAVQPVIYV